MVGKGGKGEGMKGGADAGAEKGWKEARV